MDFGDYTDGAVFAADLVNTLGSPSGREYLDADKLRNLLSRAGLNDQVPIDERVLAEVRRVRQRIREVFFAETEEDTVRLINALLADHGAIPHLTNHDGRPWHLHFAAPDAPVADRVASAAALGLAQAIHDSGRARLGVCSASPCGDVFIDTSRNRSRRYCHESCASRANVAAFRARQRA